MTIQILTQQELVGFHVNWKHNHFKTTLKEVIRDLQIATKLKNPFTVHPVVNWLLMLHASGQMTRQFSLLIGHAGSHQIPRYLDEAVGLAIGLSSWPHQSSIEYINPRYKELHEFFDGLVNTDEKFKSLVEDLLNTGFSIHEYND